MPILAACGEDGLWIYREKWRRAACPLQRATLAMPCGGAADAVSRLWWNGRSLLPLPPGTERLCRWGRSVLALSGEADSLSMLDASGGQMLLAARAGVYPQDMCMLQGGAAVCGGADGRIRLFSLPDLRVTQSFDLPGNVQRMAVAEDKACVLSATGEESIRCLAGILSLRDGGYTPATTMPGLPGAVCSDGAGGWWIAASERLCHIDASGRADRLLSGFGLVNSLCLQGETLLAADPVMGRCSLIHTPTGQAETLLETDAQQALFIP